MHCLKCKSAPRKAHKNAKYCKVCADLLRKKPASNLTKEQIRQVKKYAGRLYVNELAEKIGCSRSSLRRYAREHGVSINAHKYDQKTIDKVINYYLNHSLPATEHKFKNISPRSIIDRYLKGVNPKTEYWSDDDLIKIARLQGLLSYFNIAAQIDRKYVTAKSIKSVWVKRFKSSGANINGMAHWIAKYYVKNSCPIYQTSLCAVDIGEKDYAKKICLWVDIAENMRDDLDDFIKSAFKALARFQFWLHGSKDNILNILNMEHYNVASYHKR